MKTVLRILRRLEKVGKSGETGASTAVKMENDPKFMVWI